MKKSLTILAMGAMLGLGACSDPGVVARAMDPGMPLLGGDGGAVRPAPSYRVREVRVSVPETLKVSEANSYKPRADIVWRGDPIGNRYEQVAAVMKEGIERGVAGLDGSREVVLEVEVATFHALTQKARYTVGGTHDINFWLTIRDARTGEVIEPRRYIDTDLKALGGVAAIAAEAHGETQKVRIEAFLADYMRNLLTTPHMIPADPAPAVAQADAAPAQG